MNINQIKYALDGSIKSEAEKAIRGQLSRSRKLSVADAIRLLIGAEGGSLDKILHAAGIEVTASAVSQRRAQIDPAVFRAVFDSFNAACVDTEMFHGYRLFAVDGTTVNLPRNPASASFVCNDGIPNGVNQLHVTPLYDLLSRTFIDTVIQPEPKKGIYAYKVNFKMAVALCREFIRTPKADADKLLSDIARYTVPIRPGRQDERNLRVKGFPGFVYRVAA